MDDRKKLNISVIVDINELKSSYVNEQELHIKNHAKKCLMEEYAYNYIQEKIELEYTNIYTGDSMWVDEEYIIPRGFILSSKRITYTL